MSRFRSAFVPASIAIVSLASGLQLPASAVSMAPTASPGAGHLPMKRWLMRVDLMEAQ